MRWYCLLWLFVKAFFARRASLTMENLALRQQLAIMNRKTARPRLRNRKSISRASSGMMDRSSVLDFYSPHNGCEQMTILFDSGTLLA